MTMLTIKDLPMIEGLDRKAMAALHGGAAYHSWPDSMSAFCGTAPSPSYRPPPQPFQDPEFPFGPFRNGSVDPEKIPPPTPLGPIDVPEGSVVF